jgi:hypothetical protein
VIPERLRPADRIPLPVCRRFHYPLAIGNDSVKVDKIIEFLNWEVGF